MNITLLCFSDFYIARIMTGKDQYQSPPYADKIAAIDDACKATGIDDTLEFFILEEDCTRINNHA